MYQLLLDSSNKYLSVGLSKDGKVVDKIFYEAWQRQSEMMVTEVDNILKRNNIDKSELDGVVVGVGPGSYTGVRIGVTIAKTIAYNNKEISKTEAGFAASKIVLKKLQKKILGDKIVYCMCLQYNHSL